MENAFNESELSKLFKIRKTILKMISDRGYSVSIIEKEKSYDDWKSLFKSKKESMTFFCTKSNDSTDNIYIEFMDSPKLGVEEISMFCEKIKEKRISCGIIVISGTLTPLAKQKLKDSNEILHVEYFEEKELIVNITEHELVPKHILLTDEEKKMLLKK